MKFEKIWDGFREIINLMNFNEIRFMENVRETHRGLKLHF